jgi:hypothetical protein
MLPNLEEKKSIPTKSSVTKVCLAMIEYKQRQVYVCSLNREVIIADWMVV